MRENINEELAKSLLDSIRGEGEDVRFSEKDIKEDRRRQYEISERAIREERRLSAMAREAASHIYITI
jgi:hypothetical protein